MGWDRRCRQQLDLLLEIQHEAQARWGDGYLRADAPEGGDQWRRKVLRNFPY
jgi:hypothetical protein